MPRSTVSDLRELSFENWIDHIGVDELARILRVTPATIRHWKAGRCDPRVDHMRRIKKMTRGKMGYERMIDRHILTIAKRRARRGARKGGA